jgi:hypothetical protein
MAEAWRIGVDTSFFVLDLPAWLSWTSDALNVASFCLALLAIVLVGCIAAQIVTAGHSDTPKRRTHVVHWFLESHHGGRGLAHQMDCKK